MDINTRNDLIKEIKKEFLKEDIIYYVENGKLVLDNESIILLSNNERYLITTAPLSYNNKLIPDAFRKLIMKDFINNFSYKELRKEFLNNDRKNRTVYDVVYREHLSKNKEGSHKC